MIACPPGVAVTVTGVVSRLVALAVIAAPALALAGPAPGNARAPDDRGASCHCARTHAQADHARHLQGATPTASAPAATTAEDVRRVWNSP